VRFEPVTLVSLQEGTGSHLPGSAEFFRGIGIVVECLCQLPAVGGRFLTNRNGFASTIPRPRGVLRGIRAPESGSAALAPSTSLSAQILMDLDELDRMGQLAVGSVPIVAWLKNAAQLLGPTGMLAPKAL